MTDRKKGQREQCEERDEHGFCLDALYGRCIPYEISGCTKRKGTKP